MNQQMCIQSLHQLGLVMLALGENREWPGHSIGLTASEYDTLNDVIENQARLNPWFTSKYVRHSFSEWGKVLTEEKLTQFVNGYSFTSNSKNVAIIMAGNIPLVGFHDLVCVLLSGHRAICKLSSEDNVLLPVLAKVLNSFNNEFTSVLSISTGPIKEIDAVIATGSDNSSLYFEQYFGKYPHIFRKNRTSIAILNGTESDDQLKLLGRDMFDYFGRGCRNVSHLLLPKGYDINNVIRNLVEYGDLIHHNKFANNYDYNRAMFLLNKVPFLDNNFVLFRETTDLHSPLAVIHYHFYSNQSDIYNYLSSNKDSIQVVIGNDYVNFGQAQSPNLSDFADNVDTFKFLNSLN